MAKHDGIARNITTEVDELVSIIDELEEQLSKKRDELDDANERIEALEAELADAKAEV